MKPKYNINSSESIINYAKKLKGNTLRGLITINNIPNKSNKGRFGQMLEEYYFEYSPNSNSKPDFEVVGLELKASPLKILRNGEFRSKERLVLNIINYEKIHLEFFQTSSFLKKNKHLLLVFYLYDRSIETVIDYLIMLVDDWKFPKEDLEIIKDDWQKIVSKVKDGKAHELSEGDTFYLGACTKGATAKSSERRQPFNEQIKAKQRAFSLKQGYVNHIIASISKSESEQFGKIISKPSEIVKYTLEEIVLNKFKPLIGKSDIELETYLKIAPISKNIKNYHSKLLNLILKSIFLVPMDKKIEEYIEEFSKADVTVKVVRLDKNNTPKESVSLPAFKYIEISEARWIDSKLKYYVDRKYLFIFFKYDENDNLILDKVKFWNMSNNDISEAKQVWLNLKRLILNGSIVKEIKKNSKGSKIRMTNFPSIKSFHLHVRPHGRNSKDTYPLPVMDKKTKSMEFTKQCFWFNADYVKNEIYLK